MGSLFLRQQPFRAHLLTIFLLILFVVCGALIGINVVMGRDAAVTVAERHMDTAIDGISERTQRLFREIQTFVRTASAMRPLGEPPGPNGHPMLPMLLEAIHSLSDVDGMFIGYADGSFLHLVDLSDAPAWRERLKAPEKAVLAMRTILQNDHGGRTSQWSFYDQNEHFLERGPEEDATYDPRVRPWYRNALDSDVPTWSAPYQFATTNQVGITVSRMVEGGGAVIGVDVTLDQLALFMGQQKISPSSVAAIFDQQGYLLVHPDISHFHFSSWQTPHGEARAIVANDNDDPVMKAVFAKNYALRWRHAGNYTFTVKGETYIGAAFPMPEGAGPRAVLTISAPVDEITESVDAITQTTLAFSLITMMVAIPVVAYIARSVSQSLTALSREAEHLPLLNNTPPLRLKSRIQEIGALAEALASSKAALNTFGRYVPKSLVRKIVQSGEEPVLGGERRLVTFMFTDIEGFTSISEAIAPEVLVDRLSRYLSGISRVIHDNGGTINKYIGDAVMAMWNVPEAQGNHLAAACRSALQAKLFLEGFNAELVKQGVPPFRTRFGIHSGEVVVGHIGDDDHIEYTALGDAVNVAARLEGLNKDFGTTILISEAVAHEIAGEFEVRFVSAVAPKGRQAEVKVYELIKAHPIIEAASAVATPVSA